MFRYFSVMVGSAHAEERPGQHRVVALVHPDQNLFELAAAAEVFGLDRPGLPSRYSFAVCAERPGRLATLSGVGIDVTHSMAALRGADTVVVAGWQPVATGPSQALLEVLLSAHESGVRVVSICSGAFLLAETGLLAGREAVTHWTLADELRRRHPDVVVRDDVLYVDHGDVATSAGTAAGIDLCLHLARVDFGAAYAAAVARRMVTAPHREGGQSQYVETPVRSASTDGGIAGILEYAVARLGTPLNVTTLAEQHGMSASTLARRFGEEIGQTPGQWILEQRLALARRLLEETPLTIDAVAARCGLGSDLNLRRHFQHRLHTTPAGYRRTFQAGN